MSGNPRVWILLLFCFAVAEVRAQTRNDLDPRFGVDGLAYSNVPIAVSSHSLRPVVQPDGKIVICGTGVGDPYPAFTATRFTAAGALDETFGVGGSVRIPFAGGGTSATCSVAALQTDGKIVLAGQADSAQLSHFGIARVDAAGVVDTTFGDGTGTQMVPIRDTLDSADYVQAIAVQPDGRILVAGYTQSIDGADNFDMAAIRLTADGALDPTFNGNGIWTFAVDAPGGDLDEGANAVAIDPIGRIVLAGNVSGDEPGTSQFLVVRLYPDGSFDDEFNGNGRASVRFGPDPEKASASAIVIEPNLGITLAGAADTSFELFEEDFAVARLLEDGSLDRTFGEQGRVQVPFDLISADHGHDNAFDLAELADGHYAVVGRASYFIGADYSERFRAAVARLDRYGTADLTFGAGGRQVYDFGTDSQEFSGAVLQGDRLLLCGSTKTGQPATFRQFTARLIIDRVFADGFD